MKHLLLFILAWCIYFVMAAQHLIGYPELPARLGEFVPLDSSYIECIFEYTAYDPAIEKTEQKSKILEVGRSVTKYCDYGLYRVDSVIAADFPDRKLSLQQYLQLSVQFLSSSEAIIKNLGTGILTDYARQRPLDKFVYEEPIPAMEWTLQQDTEVICGYPCRKATTSFRGRDWTVWYCPEIPIDNGPWKFGGLPGLILKAESADNEHKFEATTIRNSSRVIGLEKSRHQKTTREKYQKTLKHVKGNLLQALMDNPLLPKDENGNRMMASGLYPPFFNPIELE